MKKNNSKAIAICTVLIIAALAIGVFIGIMIARNSKASNVPAPETQPPVQNTIPQSETETEPVSTEPETQPPSESDGNENSELVLSVGDHKVYMDEVNFRLYMLRSYFIQYYGEEPWSEVVDGKTVAEMAKAQLEDEIIRSEILLDKAKDYKIEPTQEIQASCRSDADKFISDLGSDVTSEFGLTANAAYSVYINGEITNQVTTAMCDEIRENLKQDSANSGLSDQELDEKVTTEFEKQMESLKSSYNITYSDIWDNIVVGSVG